MRFSIDAHDRRRWFAAGALFGAIGCAAINPVLTPARVLRAGQVSVDTGSGYAAPLADTVLGPARVVAATSGMAPLSDADRTTLVRAAAGYGSTPAGIAPYVAVRVGVAGVNELQFAWLGRAVRFGARRVLWTSDVWAASFGLQARVGYAPGGGDEFASNVTIGNARSVGADAVLVVGRTSSGLYDVWLGARAGYQHGAASITFDRVQALPFGTAMHRFEFAAFLGLRAGFGPIAGKIELDFGVSPFWATSDVGARADGLALLLRPSAAIEFTF